MARPPIKTSQRFSRAARAERDRLQRQRLQLQKKREGWQAKIDALDAEMEAIDQQLQVLEELADSKPTSIEIHSVEARGQGGPELLKGAEIRAVAVPLLIRRHGSSPIHYRDWYALFNNAGYAAAGKRPDAVFLNQVSRSPLVRGTTKAGYYVLELDAVDRLRERLRQQQAELSQILTNIPQDGPSLEAHRKRQQELSTEIARAERELREAVLALEAAEEQVAVERPRAEAA